MTPRQRVIAALLGERANKVPFTAYADQLPQSTFERRLRNGGLCIIRSRPNVFRTITPNIECEQIHFDIKGIPHAETRIHTPTGDLSARKRLDPATNTSWYIHRLFQKPEDYHPLKTLFADQQFQPNYVEFLRVQEQAGDDLFILPSIGYSPLHYIMYTLMGLERFALEWAERRDEILALYEILVENRRRLYPIVAESPALLVNYDGDISPEIVGLDRFTQYYLPHYDEFADLMHRKNKLTSIHLDGNTWMFENEIGASQIDCIESFTPPPDGDLDLAQARVSWPAKVLWVNFPPSIHFSSVEDVAIITRNILRQVGEGERFLLGITDAISPDQRQNNLNAILNTLNAAGGLPLNVWN